MYERCLNVWEVVVVRYSVGDVLYIVVKYVVRIRCEDCGMGGEGMEGRGERAGESGQGKLFHMPKNLKHRNK